MHVRDQPDDGGGERDDEHEEDDTPVSAFLAQGASWTLSPGFVTVAFILQGEGNVEAVAPFVGPTKEFLALAA